MACIYSIVLFFLSAFLAWGQVSSNLETIAVLSLDGQQGVTKDEARILSDRLAIELNRAGRYQLINRQRMADLLALQKFSQMESCSATDCAVEAGKIVGANFIIFGSIGKIGNTFSINTYIVSVESGATLASASTDNADSIEDLLTKGIAENAATLSKTTGSNATKTTSKPTCAVLNFDSRGGISPDEIRLFSDRFAIEFDKLQAYTLVPRSKMEAVLKEQQFSRTDNCSASECAVEAGKLLGVRYMSYGSVGLIGNLYTINTYLVDVETGAAIKMANLDLKDGKEAVLTRGMRLNAMALLGLTEQQGYLNITVFPAETELRLNGDPISAGRIPVPANIPIHLTAKASAYLSSERTIRVTAGETMDINMTLRRALMQTPIVRDYKDSDVVQPPKRPKVH